MQSSMWGQFGRLLKYALPYKRSVVTQFALMGIAIGVGLLKPWPLKVLVDSVVGNEPFHLQSWKPRVDREVLLLLTCLVYLFLHGGESLIQFGSTTIAALRTSRMIRNLRADLLRALLGLSLRFHDTHKVGDLVHRISFNTTAVETAFQTGFMGVIKSVLMLGGILVVMVNINPLLTIVALGIVPLLLLVIRFYAKHIHRRALDHQMQEGSVSSQTQEILSSIRLVLAFHRADWEQKRFEKVCDRSIPTRLRITIADNGFTFAVALILTMGTALLFWVGIHQVLSGGLTVGEFLVFSSYLGMLYGPLSVLSSTASAVQSSLGGASRLFEILDSDADVRDRPGVETLEMVEGAIEVESVCFAYQPGHTILKRIDFCARRGEMVAIVGETGGGKTTLLNLIMRFYDPQEGRIALDGRDLRDVTLDSLRRFIALVPQEMLLFPDSIRENIAYGRPSAGEAEIREAARIAEAHDFIMEMPEGYDTMVGERGVRLSMGQRQRIGLARAILKDAPILLLDEPTAALDALTETRLMENLEDYRAGKTVVLVSHRLSTIRKADRVYIVSHGRIVESGSHDELLDRGGAYARMWKAQMEGHPMLLQVKG